MATPREHTLTDEQRAFVEAELPRDALVLSDAVAGSGKTTTLAAFARHHAEKRILYLVFNTAVREEAERRMPANARPRTLHSLALEVARATRAVRGQPPINLVPTIDKAVLLDYVLGDATTSKADAAFLRMRGASTWLVDLFRLYLHDTQIVVDDAYVRRAVMRDVRPFARQRLEDAVRALAHGLRVAWRGASNGALAATHDVCAKLMFKVGASIAQSYDVVLCDEAQDVSAQFLAVIMKWRGTVPLVFVGDRCQHIYSFLGTSNVFGAVAPTHAFALTASFRFGDAIAALARAASQRALVGAARHASRTLEADVPRLIPAHVVALKRGTTAYLHRTNVQLLLHAAEIARMQPPKTIGIAGRGASVFKEVEDLLHDLATQAYMIDLKLKRATDEGDGSKKALIEWVRAKRGEAAEIVRVLKDRAKTGAAALSSNVDALLCTVHGAKGLEWEFVVVGDDLLPESTHEFKELKEKDGTATWKREPAWKRARTAVATSASTLASFDPDSDVAAAATTSTTTTTTTTFVAQNDELSEDDVEPLMRTQFASIDADEGWRLLYVALTRARDTLVVSPRIALALRKREAHFAQKK